MIYACSSFPPISRLLHFTFVKRAIRSAQLAEELVGGETCDWDARVRGVNWFIVRDRHCHKFFPISTSTHFSNISNKHHGFNTPSFPSSNASCAPSQISAIDLQNLLRRPAITVHPSKRSPSTSRGRECSVTQWHLAHVPRYHKAPTRIQSR